MHHFTIAKTFEEEVDSLVKRKFKKQSTKKNRVSCMTHFKYIIGLVSIVNMMSFDLTFNLMVN